jgi:NDP-sugar pyrophosphorylase family protein
MALVVHHGSDAALALRGMRALLLVGGRGEVERFNSVPLALFDVLGRSVLLRTMDRLHEAGVAEISVLADCASLASCVGPEHGKVITAEIFWEEALRDVRRLSHQSEAVFVVRLGGWAELDYAALAAHHRRRNAAVTRACLQHGEPLDVFLVSSSARSEAAALLRGELRDERIAPVLYKSDVYANRLESAADLRHLVLDVFAGSSTIVPSGRQLRPGVWVGAGARIHRDARLLAPAFVGNCCNVHRGAVVTRGSSMEHDCELDCAAVLDNSSLLPNTRIGAGLDVEQAVVGLRHVYSLKHNVDVKVEDHRLVAATDQNSMRVLSAVYWLLSLLPGALWKLFFEAAQEVHAENATTSALSQPELAKIESESKAYREMAGARRYGDE